jgi:hypothetical protein
MKPLGSSPRRCLCLHGQIPGSLANLRDVAIIFHAHCLSPFRFYCDMNRRGSGLWEKRIAFPLERLHALINSGDWSEPESELLWNEVHGVPYQLWGGDPLSGAELQLQDIEFPCPWCNHSSTIALDEFTLTHTAKRELSKCSSCARQFNPDNITAKYFKDDCLENIKTQNGWYAFF